MLTYIKILWSNLIIKVEDKDSISVMNFFQITFPLHTATYYIIELKAA